MFVETDIDTRMGQININRANQLLQGLIQSLAVVTLDILVGDHPPCSVISPSELREEVHEMVKRIFIAGSVQITSKAERDHN